MHRVDYPPEAQLGQSILVDSYPVLTNDIYFAAEDVLGQLVVREDDL